VPLYVVATPIGNLEDLTLRAVRVLSECDRVLAEDTRRTLGLLSHLGLKKPLDRLDEHARAADIERALGFLAEGKSLCLVSDAGTPLVSDPGASLVRAALSANHTVVPIPGPSAILAALVLAGVAGSFRFVGFFPRSGSERTDALASAATDPSAVVFFEAPGRIGDTLRDLAELVPDRRVTVTRELTKMHEARVEGTLRELAASTEEVRGEITVVLHPFAQSAAVPTAADIDKWIDDGLIEGTPVKKLAEIVAARSGQSRREIYARVRARKA
jgi:16S rRNA (cytidine1402-2'-O)-methyltransferase